MWRATSAALLLILAAPAWATRPIGWNLGEVNNFNTAHPFCDLMKETGRTWSSGGGGSGLVEDANGWPTSITGGVNAYYSVTTRIDQLHADFTEAGDIAHYPTGEYTIKCDGTVKVGVFRNGPDLTYACAGTNSFTFNVDATTGEGLEFRVYGDTITNSGSAHLFQVYPSGTNAEACDPATETFNPRFRRALRGSYGGRFMDMAGPAYRLDTITYLDGRTWANRTPLAARTYASSDSVHNGVPPEVPILLANEMLSEEGQVWHPWIVFPVSVTDDYVTGYATYAESTLNASLNAFLEWGNEVWNTGGAYIDQFNFVLALANAASVTGSDGDKVKKYQGWRSTQVYRLWETTFGGVTRLRRVIGMQAKDCCNPSDASTYLSFDPAGDDPVVRLDVDYAAFAPYGAAGDAAGGAHAKHTQNALSASYDGVVQSQCGTTSGQITSSSTPFTCCSGTCVGMRAWTPQQWCDSLRSNIASLAQQMQTHVTAVTAFQNGEGATIRPILYEGWVNHDDAVGGDQTRQTGEWDSTLAAARQAAHRADCMEDVGETYLNAVAAVIGTSQPMFLFTFVDKWTKFRQFGLSEYLTDANGDHAYGENPNHRAARYYMAKP